MASNLLSFDWTQDKSSQYEADDDFGEFTSAAGPSLPIVKSLNSIIQHEDLPTVDYAGIQPMTTPTANGFFGTKKLLTSTFSKPPTLPVPKSAPLVPPQSLTASSVSSQSALDGLDDFGDFCTSPAFPIVPQPTSVPNATTTAVSAVFQLPPSPPPPPVQNVGTTDFPAPPPNTGIAPSKPNYCISLDEEELFTPTIAWVKPEDRLTEAPSAINPVPAPVYATECFEEDEFGDFAAAQTSFNCETSPPSNFPAPTVPTVSSTPNYNAIGPKDALSRLRTNFQPTVCLSSFQDLDQSAVPSALSGFDSPSLNKNDIAFLDDEQGLTVGYFNPLEEEPPSQDATTPPSTTEDAFGDFVQFPVTTESSGALESPDDDFGDFIQPNFESPSLILPSSTKLEQDSDAGKKEDEAVEEIVEAEPENHVSSPESDSRLSPEGLSAGEEDEFGDFATEFNPPLPELEIPIVKPVLSSLEPEEKDDFGDFADFTSAPIDVNHVEELTTSVGAAAEFDSESSDDGFDDFAAAPTPSSSSCSSLPLNLELQSSSVETQLQTLVKTIFPLPTSAVKEGETMAPPISSLDLLCQSSRGAIWAYVRDPNATPALSFQWSRSKLRDTWLKAIGVDEHSLTLGGIPGFVTGMPRFAASLSTPLQPVKLGSPATPISDASASTVDGSGLCNTLDLDFFVTRSPNGEGDSARVVENNLDVVFAKPASKSPLSVPKFSPNTKVSGLVSQSSLLDDFLSPSQSLSESRNLNNLGPTDLLA